MSLKQPTRLGPTAETLLIPLFARTMENRRKRPILADPKAAEMVEGIDWDFQQFNQRLRVVACNLRSAMYDEWVAEFVRRNPHGTVVEIGAGLNLRFERLDNGTVHWFDLGLPDVVELRRKLFSDSERRRTLASSVLDAGWVAAVRQSPGPYFFVAEAVFVYLPEADVKAALAQIARSFSGASIALDTAAARAVEGGDCARMLPATKRPSKSVVEIVRPVTPRIPPPLCRNEFHRPARAWCRAHCDAPPDSRRRAQSTFRIRRRADTSGR